MRSLEMASQITKPHNNQYRSYKDQHHKGNVGSSVSGKPDQYGQKYPRLPSDIAQELQQKVYSNSYQNYYNNRTQFIKNKFDSLTLDNRHPTAKPFPLGHTAPINIHNNSPPRTTEAPKNQHCTINRLEESYWAQWKPNKCEETNSYRDYVEHIPCKKTTRPMVPMIQRCINALPQRKRQAKIRCCEEMPLEIIREPADICESNSSDVDINHKEGAKKSSSSCCPCSQEDSDSKSDNENQQYSREEPVELGTSQSKSVEYKTLQYESLENKITQPEQYFETNPVEYENLYNEIYKEYEEELMNQIGDYEMQKGEHEIITERGQLVERQLAERQLVQNQLKYETEQDIIEIVQEAKQKAEEKLFSKMQNGNRKRVGFESYQLAGLEAEEIVERAMRESDKFKIRREEHSHKEGNTSEMPQGGTNLSKQNPEEEFKQNNVRASDPNDTTVSLQSKQYEPKDDASKDLTKDKENMFVLGKEFKTLSQEEAKKDVIKASTSNEYSEPEITLLKHTDSFIINSRRQKEERPRKPQPRFLKLSKLMLNPPVKGHAYPLKSAMKKEKILTQVVHGRSLSPVSLKIRSPSKQYQGSYLIRH